MAQEIKRSKNFNNTEVLLLLDLVKKFKDAVENKECGAVSFKQKNEAWVEISKQFNAESGGQPRSYKVLKEKWNNMKRNTTKSIAKIKKHMGGTGGGPSCNETLSSQETAVLEIIGDRLTGMYSECDSDIPKNAPKDSRETTILEIETDLTADHENIFILEDLDLMPASEKMVIEPSTSLEEQIDENKENDWGDFKSTLLRTPIAKPLALQNGNVNNVIIYVLFPLHTEYLQQYDGDNENELSTDEENDMASEDQDSSDEEEEEDDETGEEEEYDGLNIQQQEDNEAYREEQQNEDAIGVDDEEDEATNQHSLNVGDKFDSFEQ
ncbi:unnamed protein product [Brassicogethes aeneus]|uniref:Regulatory protein zeste n=1 Tax=Brassicogethes aeneus TaxID=1431903 RepID=A0A9P0B629_BRAAE|nr:unnamed protein product [Brassicogethes aeneus]